MVSVVTMIHHAYGAWAYDDPWRRHVGPIAAALIAAIMVLARYGNAPSARAALVALVVIAPIGWIGLFEGVYNHAAKLLLYAAEPNGALYQRLFPNDTYEFPEHWLFSAPGFPQILPALLACLLLPRI